MFNCMDDPALASDVRFTRPAIPSHRPLCFESCPLFESLDQQHASSNSEWVTNHLVLKRGSRKAEDTRLWGRRKNLGFIEDFVVVSRGFRLWSVSLDIASTSLLLRNCIRRWFFPFFPVCYLCHSQTFFNLGLKINFNIFPKTLLSQ